ncbi:hypothetical protein F5Y05DRAFT_422032 [Hypoxylon sp. FL0543]|nr:hypothetical protein F5Y05DRAFT_422032 [Hypoxylon sp. FL0543]
MLVTFKISSSTAAVFFPRLTDVADTSSAVGDDGDRVTRLEENKRVGNGSDGDHEGSDDENYDESEDEDTSSGEDEDSNDSNDSEGENSDESDDEDTDESDAEIEDIVVGSSTFPRFSGLPKELQLMIWEEAIVQDGDRVISVSLDGEDIFVARAPTPKWLLVNREAHSAALKFYTRIQDGILGSAPEQNPTGPLVSFEHDIFYLLEVDDYLVFTLDCAVADQHERLIDLPTDNPQGQVMQNILALVLAYGAKRLGLEEDARYFPGAVGSIAGNQYLLWSLGADELWWIIGRNRHMPVKADHYGEMTKKQIEDLEQKRVRYDRRRNRYFDYSWQVERFEKEGRHQEARILERWTMDGAEHSEDMDHW